ncbi:hypothetical protein D0T49_08415, partial [Paludibacter sp. 221]|uniref:tail fiber domain-containing protein n=1 Tax=Paludibacter sp. 221 TaxID=2302939 RepID=UPI0013D1DF21
LGDTIVSYISENITTQLRDSIVSAISTNVTQELTNNIMSKVKITGLKGIVVGGSGTSSISVSLPNGTDGQVLKWNDTTKQWEASDDTSIAYTPSTSITLNGTEIRRAALTGDVTATANSNATTVARIRGRNVATTAPTAGQVLKWNGSAWAPAADDNTDTNTFPAVSSTTGLAITGSGTATQTINLPGGTADGQIMKWNDTTKKWESGTDENTTYTASASITLNGTEIRRAALTGDVTATANSNATTVARIRGRNVSTTAPTTGQVLKFDGTNWAPAADNNTDTNTFPAVSSTTGLVVTGSGTATQTINLPTGTAANQVLKWNATTKQWALGTDANTNTFPAVSSTTGLAITGSGTATQTINLPAGTADGQVMKWNATSKKWEPVAINTLEADAIVGNEVTNATNSTLVRTGSGTAAAPYTLARAAISGDVTIPAASNAATVTKIQGKSIATTAPAANQVLKWNGSSWAPAADNEGWSLTGNAANSGSFIGTTNTTPLIFKVNNTVVGYIASVASSSTSFGYDASRAGTENVAIGYQALKNATSTAYSNVAIGHGAASGLTTGFHNVIVGGTKVGSPASDITTGSFNILIGSSLYGGFSPTADSQLGIGLWIMGNYNETLKKHCIGVGGAMPQSDHVLYVNGKAGGSTAWTQSSDRRLKTNIRGISYGLPQVMKLNPVSFTMKESGNKQIGFIAQEVRDIIPEIVSGTEGDIEKGEVLGISYAEFAPVLVKAIQEQQVVIEQQQKTIDTLIRRIEALEKK